MNEKSCGTCRYKDRFLVGTSSYRCLYFEHNQDELIKLPEWIQRKVQYWQNTVENGDGKNCPSWEVKS